MTKNNRNKDPQLGKLRPLISITHVILMNLLKFQQVVEDDISLYDPGRQYRSYFHTYDY